MYADAVLLFHYFSIKKKKERKIHETLLHTCLINFFSRILLLFTCADSPQEKFALCAREWAAKSRTIERFSASTDE